MRIRIIPMPYGECLILQWKDSQDVDRTIILDSGTVSSYRHHLRQFLAELDGDIDLWVISHIHDDHIGGVLKYIDDMQGGILDVKCRQWLFNHICKDSETFTTRFKDGSVAESVRQGNILSAYLNSIGVSDVECAAVRGKVINIDNAKLIVLNPSDVNLRDEENIPSSFAASSGGNDYGKAIDSFEVGSYKEDSNAINASSMALLIELSGKRLLWMADSVSSEVCAALEQLGYSKSNPLICDCMTLPHHGSKGNISKDLLEIIRCKRFIVTSDGENIHNLPNKEALSKVILCNKKHSDSPTEIIFPSDNNTLQNLFRIDGTEAYNIHNFRISLGVTSFNL